MSFPSNNHPLGAGGVHFRESLLVTPSPGLAGQPGARRAAPRELRAEVRRPAETGAVLLRLGCLTWLKWCDGGGFR